MLPLPHVSTMRILLANFEEMCMREEALEQRPDLPESWVTHHVTLELNKAMRLLTDGLTREAREAVKKAITAAGGELPFPVVIED